MYEGTVENIEFVSPAWFKIKLKEYNRPIMIHVNWFLARDGLLRSTDGYVQTIIKLGDKIRFKFVPPVYPTDKENLYVNNVELVHSATVEVETL